MSLCALLTASGADAAAQTVETAAPETRSIEQLVDSPLKRLPDYSGASDHELTRVGAQWDSLNKDEKEALLREVKMRMAQRKDRDGVLMIRTQRRYGRVYGGGQYLKIETKVVRITPDREALSSGRGFGVGFEHRSAEVAGTPTGEAAGNGEPRDPNGTGGAFEPPVVRVTDVTP
ncbi:MAG: hypothetical protein AB7I04_14440 [Pseudomonadales bacterium]